MAENTGKTIRRIADEIGVTKQAVYKRLTRNLNEAISPYIYKEYNRTYILPEGEQIIKQDFIDNPVQRSEASSPVHSEPLFASEHLQQSDYASKDQVAQGITETHTAQNVSSTEQSISHTTQNVSHTEQIELNTNQTDLHTGSSADNVLHTELHTESDTDTVSTASFNDSVSIENDLNTVQNVSHTDMPQNVPHTNQNVSHTEQSVPHTAQNVLHTNSHTEQNVPHTEDYQKQIDEYKERIHELELELIKSRAETEKRDAQISVFNQRINDFNQRIEDKEQIIAEQHQTIDKIDTERKVLTASLLKNNSFIEDVLKLPLTKRIFGWKNVQKQLTDSRNSVISDVSAGESDSDTTVIEAVFNENTGPDSTE